MSEDPSGHLPILSVAAEKMVLPCFQSLSPCRSCKRRRSRAVCGERVNSRKNHLFRGQQEDRKMSGAFLAHSALGAGGRLPPATAARLSVENRRAPSHCIRRVSGTAPAARGGK